jgi:hypothetical protein
LFVQSLDQFPRLIFDRFDFLAVSFEFPCSHKGIITGGVGRDALQSARRLLGA